MDGKSLANEMFAIDLSKTIDELISGNFDATAISYKQIFLFQTISTVAQAAQVTPLRIANPTMYMDQSQAYFVATLLDKAPSISK